MTASPAERVRARAAAPVPDRISALSVRQGNVVDLAHARETGQRAMRCRCGPRRPLAATLAVGIFTGNMLPPGQAGPIRTEDGQMVAGGEARGRLYAQLASAPAEQGPRIGMTYRDKTGVSAAPSRMTDASGLACRQGGDWRIRGLFQNAEGQSSDYRMAAGADPRLMDMVDDSIAGEPFDAAQEQEASRRGWN